MAGISILEDQKYSYLVNKQPFFFRIWKKIFYYYCKFVFLWYTPVRIYGRENLPDGSAIFCSNHNSHMDVALLSAAAGKSFNYFGMLAAKDYWFDSNIKRVLTNFVMNLVPIARRSEEQTMDFPFDNTIALCRAFMNQGNRNLVIFPEGSRGTPGDIRPFRKGAAEFSAKLNVPIVPVFIYGSHKAWPKGKIFMRPVQIQVHILDPMYPREFILNGDTDNSESVIRFIQELEKRIRKEEEKFND